MIRVSIKIFHYFILLITGIALIGVNVRLLHCCHSESSIVEVRMMPDEEEMPCSVVCCSVVCEKKTGGRNCKVCSKRFLKLDIQGV